MPNYQLSKIYEIRCNITNKKYYGSTCQKHLSQRIQTHKADYKKWLKDNKKYSYLSSFEILKNEDYKIILVENFECKTKDELRAREQHYIDNNDCINKHKAYLTEEEKKDYKIKHYQDNKDKVKEQSKKYYDDNKDKVIERHKKYNEDNKDKIQENKKKYYDDNKDKIRQIQKKYNEDNKDKIKNKQKQRAKEKRLFSNSWGYEKKVFSCNLLDIDLSILD